MNKNNSKETGQAMRPAGPIVANFVPTLAAQQLLDDGIDARSYFARLLHNQCWQDAAQLIAHGLPPRKSVWWGCLCLREAGGQPLPGAQEAALHAAVHWVLQPEDSKRVAAEEPARRATLQTPAGRLAWAAFTSGGHFPPGHCSRAVAAAVIGAAYQDFSKAEALLRRFVALGLAVSARKARWHQREGHHESV